MKRIFVICCCLSASVYSQIENSNYLVKNPSFFTKPTGLAVDMGSSITSFQGYATGSFNFGMYTDLFKNGLLGVSVNLYQNRHPRFSTPVEVINPRFKFSTYTADLEYIFLKDKKVSLSVFNKIGAAYAAYDDAYYQTYYYTGKSGGYKPKTVIDQFYFVDEPGASVHVNICRYMSLCVGSSYRFVSGASTFGSAANLNGFNANVKLRFKLSDK